MYVNNVQKNKTLNGINIYTCSIYVHIFYLLVCMRQAKRCRFCFAFVHELFCEIALNPTGKPLTQRPMGNNVTTHGFHGSGTGVTAECDV